MPTTLVCLYCWILSLSLDYLFNNTNFSQLFGFFCLRCACLKLPPKCNIALLWLWVIFAINVHKRARICSTRYTIYYLCLFFPVRHFFPPFLYMWIPQTAQSMYVFEETGLMFLFICKKVINVTRCFYPTLPKDIHFFSYYYMNISSTFYIAHFLTDKTIFKHQIF